MNILFVHNSRHNTAPWVDASTRYRCYHLAEALRIRGYKVDITSHTELQLRSLSRYNRVCVLRPVFGNPLEHLLKHCRKLRIPTVADVDDLVFVPEFSAMSPSVVNKQANEARVKSHFNKNLQAMLLFDEITVATVPLAKHWRDISGRSNVITVPNGLSERWLQNNVHYKLNNDRDIKFISYFSGSNSHDRDFSEIVNVLADTLHEHKNTRLLIVGKLSTDYEILPENRVTRIKWVDYYQLPELISASSITLAPLVSSPFTFAKSHIKYIESAAYGTPAICSPSHDILRHNSKGLLLANSEEDWFSALRHFLNSPPEEQCLMEMKARVRDTASADHSASILAAHWRNSGAEALSYAA